MSHHPRFCLTICVTALAAVAPARASDKTPFRQGWDRPRENDRRFLDFRRKDDMPSREPRQQSGGWLRDDGRQYQPDREPRRWFGGWLRGPGGRDGDPARGQPRQFGGPSFPADQPVQYAQPVEAAAPPAVAYPPQPYSPTPQQPANPDHQFLAPPVARPAGPPGSPPPPPVARPPASQTRALPQTQPSAPPSGPPAARQRMPIGSSSQPVVPSLRRADDGPTAAPPAGPSRP